MTWYLISGPSGCQLPLPLCWESLAGLGCEVVWIVLFSDVTSVDFPTSLFLPLSPLLGAIYVSLAPFRRGQSVN